MAAVSLVLSWWQAEGIGEDLLAYAFDLPGDLELYVAAKGGAPLSAEDLSVLWAEVARAQRLAPRRAERRARISPMDRALAARGSASSSSGGPSLVLVPKLDSKRVREWPSAPRRGMVEAAAPRAREARERRIRDRYVARVAAVMSRAGFPIAALDGEGEADHYLLARCGQGRRANTLRSHANLLDRVQRWLLFQGLGGWFANEKVLLTFLRDEAEGGAPISRLNNVMSAIKFAERGGGSPPRPRWACRRSLPPSSASWGRKLRPGRLVNGVALPGTC
jgi:hypothetical protein